MVQRARGGGSWGRASVEEVGGDSWRRSEEDVRGVTNDGLEGKRRRRSGEEARAGGRWWRLEKEVGGGGKISLL